MKYICKCCGVEFSASPSRGRKYCSHACNARVNFGKVRHKNSFEDFMSGKGQMTGKERLEIVNQINKPLLDGWTLGKIRAFYKRGLKCVVKDSGGMPIGEYDVEGNFKEY